MNKTLLLALLVGSLSALYVAFAQMSDPVTAFLVILLMYGSIMAAVMYGSD